MSKRNAEEMEELRQDMLRESYEDEAFEIEMRNDFDKFLDIQADAYVDDLTDAMDGIRKDLENYGWYEDPKEILIRIIEEYL